MNNNQKMESGKKIISNSIIYTISGLLLKCFSLFLLPLYTVYLSTDDYGIQSVANSFISTMAFVVAFSLFQAVMRFYVDLKDDPAKLKRFYGTVIIFVFISSLFFAAFFYLLRTLVEKYVFAGISFYPIVLICLATVVFNCQQQIYVNILRSQQKAIKCSVLSIAYFFTTLSLNILFVVFYKLGATGVLLSLLIANVLYTVYFLIDMIRTKSIVLCFDKTLLREALGYSIPLMPHDLSTRLAQLISKALIGNTSAMSSLGLFTIASQFGDIADTVQSYVNHAYGPWLFECLHKKNDGYKKNIRSVVKGLCAVIGLFFLGISLFSHDYIVIFINKSYVHSWKYVSMIVLVYGIKTMYWFYVSILLYFKKASKVLFTATLTGSIVNAVTSAVFIPLWGVYGSIIADAIAMLVRVIIIYLISKRFEDIGLRVIDFVWNYIIVVLFIFVGLIPSYLFFYDNFSVINLCYKVFIVLLYCLYLYIRYRKQIAPIFGRIRTKFIKR